MFRDRPVFADADVSQRVDIINELCFNNLFLAANNPLVLSRLSEEEIEELLSCLAEYTKLSMKNLKSADDYDIRTIVKNVKGSK